MLIRKPHVSGTFYPSDQTDLKDYCQNRFKQSDPKIRAKGVVLPHAGYVYSGDTACQVLSRVLVPEVSFLIGPNHWASGAPFAIYAEGAWETPLGKVEIEKRLAHLALESSDLIKKDEGAHQNEHSLEVLVPMLQERQPLLKIVPLIVGTLDRAKARDVALRLGECIQNWREDFLMVASSDMSHYEPDEITRKKDRYAIDAILNLDADSLASVVHEYRITMCGFVPVYMLLVMKDFLKISKASLVDYRTSADASGDKQRVVGYAGIIFE